MSDPGREVPFVVDGHTYTLYAGNRALRLVERETGETIQQAMDRLQSGDLSMLTTLLWALLQKQHAGDFPSIDDVDEVIDAVGYGDALSGPIQAAVERAFPDAVEPATASPNGAKPGKPRRASTGTSSPPVPLRPA